MCSLGRLRTWQRGSRQQSSIPPQSRNKAVKEQLTSDAGDRINTLEFNIKKKETCNDLEIGYQRRKQAKKSLTINTDQSRVGGKGKNERKKEKESPQAYFLNMWKEKQTK